MSMASTLTTHVQAIIIFCLSNYNRTRNSTGYFKAKIKSCQSSAGSLPVPGIQAFCHLPPNIFVTLHYTIFFLCHSSSANMTPGHYCNLLGLFPLLGLGMGRFHCLGCSFLSYLQLSPSSSLSHYSNTPSSI